MSSYAVSVFLMDTWRSAMSEQFPEDMSVIKTNLVDEQDGVEFAYDQEPVTEIVEDDE